MNIYFGFGAVYQPRRQLSGFAQMYTLLNNGYLLKVFTKGRGVKSTLNFIYIRDLHTHLLGLLIRPNSHPKRNTRKSKLNNTLLWSAKLWINVVQDDLVNITIVLQMFVWRCFFRNKFFAIIIQVPLRLQFRKSGEDRNNYFQ